MTLYLIDGHKMLEKWFIAVLMLTPTPELGTDVYVFKKPFDTHAECYTHLKQNSQKYFNYAVKSYNGRLKPDKANCIGGDLVKELFLNEIENLKI